MSDRAYIVFLFPFCFLAGRKYSTYPGLWIYFRVYWSKLVWPYLPTHPALKPQSVFLPTGFMIGRPSNVLLFWVTKELTLSEYLCAQHYASALPIDTHNSLMRHKSLALLSNKETESQESKWLFWSHTANKQHTQNSTHVRLTPSLSTFCAPHCFPGAGSQSCILERFIIHHMQKY